MQCFLSSKLSSLTVFGVLEFHLFGSFFSGMKQVEYLPVIYPSDTQKQNAVRLSQKVCFWWRRRLVFLSFLALSTTDGIPVNTDQSCNCNLFECRPNISFLWGPDAIEQSIWIKAGTCSSLVFSLSWIASYGYIFLLSMPRSFFRNIHLVDHIF